VFQAREDEPMPWRGLNHALQLLLPRQFPSQPPPLPHLNLSNTHGPAGGRLAPVRSLQPRRLMNTPTVVAGFDSANHGMPGVTVMALAATISDALVRGLAAAGRA